MAVFELTERTATGLLLALVGTLGVLSGMVLERTVLRPNPPSPPPAAVPATTDSERPSSSLDGVPWGVSDGELAPLPRRGDREAGRTRLLDWLDRTAGLSPEQRERVEGVLRDRGEELRGLTREFRPRFREITRATRREIRGVLTPEQRRAVRRALLEAARERRGVGGSGGATGGGPALDGDGRDGAGGADPGSS